MGWLTGGLGLSLLLAICSVHHWEVTPVASHKEDILEYDVNSIMEMATSYLGKDGVEQIINGDFSKLEKVGQTLFGGDNGDLIKKIINALPEGSIGRKLEDLKTEE